MQHFIIVADILLHVAGLAVVTNSVPTDPGLKIIMPRLQYVDPTMQRHTVARSAHLNHIELAGNRIPIDSAPYGFGPTQHVQDHQAMLIFKSDPKLVKVNWDVNPLPNDPGYSYALLDGDHLWFDSGANNPAPSMQSIMLPKLETSCCSQMTALRKDFLPPYQGAAAVFEITGGQLSSCDASVAAGTRRDSEILMPNDAGYLIVSASTMKTTKYLRFRIPAGQRLELIAANLPTGYLNGQKATPAANAIDGLPHFYAYYEMGDGQSSICRKSLMQWYSENPTPANTCKLSQFTYVANKMPGARGGYFESTQSSNFECSNSQWP